MKTQFTLIIYIFLLNYTLSQNSIDQIDSIALEICSSIKSNTTIDDKNMLELIINEHIYPYLRKQASESRDHIELRTERLCPEYSALAYRVNENNGDWVLLKQKPKTLISQELCSQFYDNQSYYYLEATGDKVIVEMKDGFWIDRFLDNTYSKLKLVRESDCEYYIQFIESNNSMRNKFSKVGDIYKYQILNYKDDKFYISAHIPGQDQYYKFIMYKNY